jgi:hypothetical protein
VLALGVVVAGMEGEALRLSAQAEVSAMTNWLFAATLGVAGFVVVTVGCSSAPDAPVAGQACTPGITVACACPGGAQGAQACKGDGSGYEGCACAMSDSGQDGAVQDSPADTAPSADAADAPVLDADDSAVPTGSDCLAEGPNAVCTTGGLFYQCNDDAPPFAIGCAHPGSSIRDWCCTTDSCVRYSSSDSACTPGKPPHAWSCAPGKYPATSGCVLADIGGLTVYCCP